MVFKAREVMDNIGCDDFYVHHSVCGQAEWYAQEMGVKRHKRGLRWDIHFLFLGNRYQSHDIYIFLFWLYLGPVNAHINDVQHKIETCYQDEMARSLQTVTGDLFYVLGIVAHTTAFDTPVVGHWLWRSSARQYTLHLSFLWDNQGWCPNWE